MSDSTLIRIYRRLTSLYPAAFREEYEGELIEAVRDRERERSGIAAAVWLWAEVLADIFTTAPKEHWHMLQHDVRVALRVLRNSPAISVTAMLVLAIGTGAATTVFSFVNGVLLRPLPFADPGRLVFIEEASASQGIDRMGPAFPNVLDYTAESRQFESIGAWMTTGFTLTGTGEAERVDGAWISASLFPTLGVQPVLGRNFLPDEDQPNQDSTVMLSYGLWQRKFGGDRSIVGRAISVNGKARTVAGIMPPGFRFPESAEIWGPLSLDPKTSKRTDHFLSVIGRMRPGVSPRQAGAELSAILKGIQARHPDETSELSIRTTPAREQLTGEYGPALWRLLGAVGLVLAIACTNIMNLLLARAAGRGREIAIRTALGAHRRRLIRQLMTESMVLGAIGGGFGMALGAMAARALARLSPVDVPYWVNLELDWRVVLFCAAVTLGSVLLFGIAPALRVSATDPARTLNDSRRGVSASRGAGRLRQTLVAAQVALSVVLLAGAGLMIRSFLKLQDFDLGFRGRDVLSFRVSLPQTRYRAPADRDAFFRRMREQLSGVPGVRSVATATGLPMAGGWWRAFQKSGETKTRLSDLPPTYHVMVSPGYFNAMGIPVKRGRDFTAADGARAPVVIVSETLARRQWPGEDPIGQLVRIDPFLPDEPWRTVVGVVGDVRAQGPRDEAPPAVYVPESFDPRSAVGVLMKSDLPPQALIQAARVVMRGLDPELPLYQVRAVSALVSEATWQFRFFTFLLSSFAGIAVLLASIGLGGIMASMVAERTHEIGVRMALGATAREVVGMVLSRALLVAGAGALAGVAAAAGVTGALAGQLFETGPHDGGTFAAVLGVLFGAAFAAAWLPARRAARVDPACALRWE